MHFVKLCTHGGVRVGPALTVPVIVKAGDRNLHDTAQDVRRKVSPLTCDEGVPHLDSLAKNAVAFFRISRSMRSSAFSARSRASSLSCSLTGLRSAELHGLPSRPSRIQLSSVVFGRPSS